jgi:hypothetical protein
MTYEIVKELTSFRDVVNHYKDNAEENWLFLSTGGWHGTGQTLDDLVRILDGKDEIWKPEGAYVTVLILDPATVTLRWGEIRVKNKTEVEWLRAKVNETINLIRLSQEGNR